MVLMAILASLVLLASGPGRGAILAAADASLPERPASAANGDPLTVRMTAKGLSTEDRSCKCLRERGDLPFFETLPQF